MRFSDVATAGKMRDLITSIAEGVVERKRPDARIGRVYSYNYDTLTAEIEFVGETQTIRAKFSPDQVPSSSVLDPWGDPNLVRVAGRPGSYYILNFVSGTPRQMKYEWAMVPTGGFVFYGGDDEPIGFLQCDGRFVSQSTYQWLFTKVGHRFNNGVDPGDGTFKLPNPADVFLMGAVSTDPTKTVGKTGGSNTVPVPEHDHGVGTLEVTTTGSAHTHDAGTYSISRRAGAGAAAGAAKGNSTLDGTVDVTGNSGTAGSTHTHGLTGLTGKRGVTDEYKPKFLALNVLIKT